MAPDYLANYPNILFTQSSLLRYRNFEPSAERMRNKEKTDKDASSIRSHSHAERRASKMRFSWMRLKNKSENVIPSVSEPKPPQLHSEQQKPNGNAAPREPAVKKLPVFFIDEAHKLYVHPQKCLS